MHKPVAALVGKVIPSGHQAAKPVGNRMAITTSARSRFLRWPYIVAAVLLVLVIASSSHPKTRDMASRLSSDAFRKFNNPDSLIPAPPGTPEPPAPANPTTEEVKQVAPEIDHFAPFRQAENCTITSMQLHHSFEPKCQSKEAVLTAMSGGGRWGFDRPYASLDCDFQWFSTFELCMILEKFDNIFVLGDSLMRQLVIAIHTLLREDLVEGGRQTWRDDNPEDQDCRCRTLFSKGSKCYWWEAIDTDGVRDNDPASIHCPNIDKLGSFSLQTLTAYPLPDDAIPFLVRVASEKASPEGKNAFLVGHGTWNGFEPNTTVSYIEQIENGVRNEMPWYFDSPRLFISPSAQGEDKAEPFIASGNNIRVQKYVHAVEKHVASLGYDHLAFFNLTVQAVSPDGTHASLESTITEAMMVFNWLYWL